jgi:superfamily II DNA or RNA helicase
MSQILFEPGPPSGHDIVYDLYPAPAGLYLPMAYIVSRGGDGQLAYIRQRALPKTIGSYGLELDEQRQKLFAIVDKLQPKALEERFNPPKKRLKPLDKLMQEAEIAKNITAYCHRLLDELLTLIVAHHLPLSWGIERRSLVHQFLLRPAEEELEPLLFFQKQEDGVRYRLQLSGAQGAWAIHTKEVIPITNRPAWLFVDDQLYRAPLINGNMVKPFQQKAEVHIQRSAVKVYFQKFILKVASKAEIEAEGFALTQHGELLACQLLPTQNIFNGRWMLAVMMAYQGYRFQWSDPKERRTILEFGEGEEPHILQVVRDAAREADFLERLRAFKLVNTAGSYFEPANAGEDPYYALEWLTEQGPALQQAGFQVEAPLVEGQPLCLHHAAVALNMEQQGDWFDLYGEVTVGEFRFPFLALASHIREGKRLYTLPDGSAFVIPQEWMARYQGLFQFGKKASGALRLAKSQYPLLEGLGLQASAGMAAAPTVGAGVQPPAALKAELRPYQLEGFRWLAQLYENQLGACLADDMGLGKTLQTIAMLLYAKERRKEAAAAPPAAGSRQLGLFEPAPDVGFLRPLQALIVLPASLVFNWEAEIQRFAPSLQVYRHTGSKRYKDPRLLGRFDVILTTYQTALRDEELLSRLEFEYIVLDESQQIKNKDSKVFRSINELAGRHKVSLSGTPIENSLSDLWAQLEFINPGLLGSHAFFQREFITPIEKRQDEEKKLRLRQLVQPYLLRRTKEQVASDLPELTIKPFYSEMTAEQKRLYEREKSAARNYLLDNFQPNDPKYRFQVLQSLTRLRQLANHPVLAEKSYAKDSGKFNDVLEHWDVIRKGGHKALIFSSFVQYLDLYRRHFEQQATPYAWLTGELNSKQRQAAIEAFQQDAAVQPFLISIKSGGTGLNLTAADYVFILDPWWNPTTEQQAIARAHRIGQDKHVIAIKFIAKDSIEEKILQLQEKKSQLAEDIIEQAGKGSFSQGDIEYLFE